MANSLTTDFDAVVLVKGNILNGLLVAFHRNGGYDIKTPELLHSFSLRFNPLDISVSAQQFVAWSDGLRASNDNVADGAAVVVQKAPPGISLLHKNAIREYEEARGGLVQLEALHGTAHVQAASPMVSFPEGTTSEIVATVEVRAQFAPSSYSVVLAQPIHGEVQASFFIESRTGPANETFQDVNVSGDDSQISFTPAAGTGIDATEAAMITR